MRTTHDPTLKDLFTTADNAEPCSITEPWWIKVPQEYDRNTWFDKELMRWQ